MKEQNKNNKPLPDNKEVGELEKDAYVVIPVGYHRQKLDNGHCTAWTQKVEKRGGKAIITISETYEEGPNYQRPQHHCFAVNCVESTQNPQPPATGDDVVERVARAIVTSLFKKHEFTDDEIKLSALKCWKEWKPEAKAAIAAMQKAVSKEEE